MTNSNKIEEKVLSIVLYFRIYEINNNKDLLNNNLCLDYFKPQIFNHIYNMILVVKVYLKKSSFENFKLLF